ncbi:histidine kinase [Magnetococcus marinus MC-1]|uniref:histidine kinase n=1 Tax=Magnetococcus marinus (strain ATCC BAA-1437 / JCM 17883 / MC-1) TaxID=156889 RepID=A0L6D3_MAGMM|nr:HAMP domain-containing sensor histidine kinase [Magnetococcus marinus]ABK43526.1 histidine kinase [Magnetococcus marinus MC-1]
MLSDDELIADLKKRFDANKKALYDLRTVTRKLEEVNKKLASSEELKSHFIAHMKNEINNPLSTILGMAQAMSTGRIQDPEQLKSLSATIFHDAYDLDFQLRNIFAAAEVEAGDTLVETVTTDLNDVIRDVLENFDHLLRAKQIQLTLPESLSQPRPFVTDTTKFRLILSNLLSNAIEFNQPGGEIVLTLGSEDQDAPLLTLYNSGATIPEASLHDIFNRFTQLDTGTTKVHRGHGLGLSICKALLDLLGGEITVKNQAQGGVEVSIWISSLEHNGQEGGFSLDGDLFFDDQIEAF